MDNVPNNVEDLKNRIIDTIETLSIEEIQRSFKELCFRVELYADMGGG